MQSLYPTETLYRKREGNEAHEEYAYKDPKCLGSIEINREESFMGDFHVITIIRWKNLKYI